MVLIGQLPRSRLVDRCPELRRSYLTGNPSQWLGGLQSSLL